MFDLRKIDFKSVDVVNIFEFKIENCDIIDGVFLSLNKLLVVDCINKRCVLCNIDGVVL